MNEVNARREIDGSVKVPPLKVYFPSRANLDGLQSAFFRHWLRNYEKGNALPVDGQVSYLFIRAYELIDSSQPLQTAAHLRDLRDAYLEWEPKFAAYVSSWISDALLLAGDLEGALAEFPPLALNRTASTQADRRLAIKTWLGLPIAGHEALAIVVDSITGFGRKNIDLVNLQLDVELTEYQAFHGFDLLQKWRDVAKTYPRYVFSGTHLNQKSGRPAWHFSGLPEAQGLLSKLAREAENVVREEKFLPRIGEGWLEETRLYYALKAAFPDEEVLHHASPKWLGRQHLDVFFPDRMVAVEYQGLQHDEPVAFFGGEEAFKKTVERDKRKLRLCAQNFVRLLYVRPGYSLDELSELIKAV